MKHTLKKTLVLVACLSAVSLVCIGIFTLWLPSRKIAAYERVYAELTKSTNKQQVLAKMGDPTKVGVSPTEYWDDVKLEPAEISRIVETLDYRVSTFFLPVTYRLSFDASGQLVGKHRY